ncbi:hypothetical protein QFZ34_002050 [Phyllobacterium ifriqiyense]|uniref:Tip attachment protein J domain-containing protein n=1 Tax=Phyllobacterium ifriqiyense TaxID=314238 RepID=A0ABU0S7Y2_9HYPH|nr:phage tail protein [Phyllobacterium ifriqiyense]MDQ0996868.1 hypothetical protein [Phyllobacterium ifriqiyense]
MAVFTAIATAIGGALGLGAAGIAVVGAVLQAAVGVGLNLIAKALAGKPEETPFSINGQMQSGGDVPRSFIMGHTVTAGSLVYANTWGNSGKTPNAYFTQVIALSDIPISGVSQLFVNGEAVTIGTLDPDGKGNRITEYETGGGNNHLWIKFHDGTQVTADSFLTDTVSTSNNPWQPTRIGQGVAYAILTSQIDPELFTGFPAFKFELQGIKLYDPSKDTTAGGVGPQRYDTPSTWGGDGDDLPAVQIYNLLRGIRYGTQWFYGLQGLASARLPNAHWIAQINKCRALIDGPDGPEPTYLTGGEIAIGAQVTEAIEAILTGCQGRLSETGGTYKIFVGAPDAAVYAITDIDILSTEEQTFTPFFGLADTINGVNASYPEPAESWNMKAAPALLNSAFEAEDGNRRLMADIQLDMVYRSSQVQRLMRSALQEARRARRHTITLGPSAWVLEPGDIIQWTSERNGYATKLFRIDGVADHANLDVTLDMTEVDPADYDWNQGTDYTPPVFVPIIPGRPAPQPIVDWFAEAEAVPDNNGNLRRPGIRLSWDPDQVDIVGIEFEVRLATSLIVVYASRTERFAEGSILISQGLLPNTLYGVRGRYIPGTPRTCLWSGWLPVLTDNILLGSDDVYIDDIVDEVNEQIGEHLEWAGNTTRWLTEQIERLNSLAAETGAQSATDKFELLASIGNVTASYTRDILVVATATQAAVSRIETLEATVNNPVTGVAATATAVDALTVTVSNQGGLITANANAITSVNVAVGKMSAGGLFRVETVATEAGALSTIGLYAVASDGITTGQAALFLSAKTGGISTINLIADRLSISNPGESAQFPFIFQSGVLTMNAARVNDIAAGMLRSSDSKMQIDLTNRRILIAD